MTPPADALADLARIRSQIRETEDELLPQLRKERDKLICAARMEGAIGDELAEASGLARQSVHTVLRDNNIPAPNRSRSAERRSAQARTDLWHAFVRAGLDPDNISVEAVRSVLTSQDKRGADSAH